MQGTLTVDKSTYAPGENIVASFTSGPGNSDDWICIYDSGFIPRDFFFGELGPHNWIYAGGSKKGKLTLDSRTLDIGTVGEGPNGRYLWANTMFISIVVAGTR